MSSLLIPDYVLLRFGWYNYLAAWFLKEIQFNIFESLLGRRACWIPVWTYAQCIIFSYNYVFTWHIYFPPSRMIFFFGTYHKVLITIWIGIFACKHLLSSNNFSQAKVLQSGVKFMNSGPFVPAKTFTLSERLLACVLNSCIHHVSGNCAKFDKSLV